MSHLFLVGHLFFYTFALFNRKSAYKEGGMFLYAIRSGAGTNIKNMMVHI